MPKYIYSIKSQILCNVCNSCVANYGNKRRTHERAKFGANNKKGNRKTRRVVPDRIAFLPGGKLLLIEVKRPGLKDGLSTRQKRVAFQLKGLGFEVVRASSLEDINAYL